MIGKEKYGDSLSLLDQQRRDAEARYHQQGLMTVYVEDEPNAVYPPHKHRETRLTILAGSARIRLDNSAWHVLEPGHEVIIGDQQEHEVHIGGEGMTYVFAASAEEMIDQGILRMAQPQSD